VKATGALEGDRARRRGGPVPYLLITPGVLWLALFFLVPVALLARMSLSVKEGRWDLDPGFAWEWQNYTDALSTFRDQLTRSFLYAGAATIACILIGYPIAYVIAVRGGRYRNVLLGLVVVPLFTSFLIRTIAWRSILADEGPVLYALGALGLVGVLDSLGITDDGRLLATHVAVIGGLTYNFLPFMILPIYVSLEKIDPRLLDAAKDLYASGARAFRKVVLPLSLPGIFAGSLLSFIPAAADFINPRFLGGPHNTMIGTVVQDRFLVQLDFPTAAALSLILTMVITLGVVAYARMLRAEELR
jgi:spermidine/putrescine transport system permease protein